MKELLLGIILFTSMTSFASESEAVMFENELRQKVLQNRTDFSVYLNALILEDLSLDEFRFRLQNKMLENRREFELSQSLSKDSEVSNDSLEDFKARLRAKVIENREHVQSIEILSEASDSELDSFRSRLRENLLKNRRLVEKH